MDLKRCLILVGLLVVLRETSGQGDLCSLIQEPCFNGGTCINQSGNIACMCLPNFQGLRCQIEVTVTTTPSSTKVSTETHSVYTTMLRQSSASTRNGSMSSPSVDMRTSTEGGSMSSSSRGGGSSTEEFVTEMFSTVITEDASSPISSSIATPKSSSAASSSAQPINATVVTTPPVDMRTSTEGGSMSSSSRGGVSSTETFAPGTFETKITGDATSPVSTSSATPTSSSAASSSAQPINVTVITTPPVDMRTSTEGGSMISSSRGGGSSTEEFVTEMFSTIINEDESSPISSSTDSQTSINTSSPAQPGNATARDTTPVGFRQSTEGGSTSPSSTGVDDLQCGLCENVTENGDCVSSGGYRTCSPADVCIYVDAVLIVADLRQNQRSIGCVEENVFEISNGLVNISDYIDGFNLPFSPEESFGLVRVCDSANFCNQLSLQTTNPMTATPTSSDVVINSTGGPTQPTTEPKTVTSMFTGERLTSPTRSTQFQPTTGGLTCYNCNGETDCAEPDVPVTTCPLEYSCIALNITVGDNPSTSVSLIRRTCERMLPRGQNCLTAKEYANDRPTSLPFNLEGVPVSGRVCSCNDDLCNVNINQEDIESLVLIVTTQGLSDEVSLEWNILGSGFDFDGFLVQVRISDSDEWQNVSPLLGTGERSYIISGIATANVSFIRVIAVDQSKKEVSRSIPAPVRKFSSGTRAPGAKNRLILPVMATSLTIVVLVVLTVSVWFKKTGRILTSKSTPRPLL